MHKSNRIQVDPKLSDVVCSFLPVQCTLFSEMLTPERRKVDCVCLSSWQVKLGQNEQRPTQCGLNEGEDEL